MRPSSTDKKEVLLTLDQIFTLKSNFSVVEKLKHLETLKRVMIKKLVVLQNKRERQEVQSLYRPCGVAVVV